MDALYNTIGLTYNSTRKADPYLADRLYHLLQPGEGKLYLDIGCGTGSTTVAIARRLGPSGSCTGLDISEPMIAAARNRVARGGHRMDRSLLKEALGQGFRPLAMT